MTDRERELAILEEVQRTLIEDGYEVVLQPNSLLVPAFLSGYQPDAIAFRSDKNLIIVVASQSPDTERHIGALRKKLAGQHSWELRLIWTTPGEKSVTLPPSSPIDISETILEIEQLSALEHYRPALLLGWAALEALGRLSLPTELGRPQSPARLIDQLAFNGKLNPNDADNLRDIIQKRNGLIHGDLGAAISKSDIDLILNSANKLLSEFEN